MNKLTEEQYQIISNIIYEMFNKYKAPILEGNMNKFVRSDYVVDFVNDIYTYYNENKSIFSDESINVLFINGPILETDEMEMYNKRILTEVFNIKI